MFQLLQPIWLYALAGLSVPIIIHLWNQRPGKTLRVGSIALVAENTVSQKKNIQLSELLLLLLRCLLLACIVLAMAGPFWKSASNSHLKGWVLMTRQQAATTYQQFRPMIDSLLSAGLEFHYFEEGFAKGNIADTINLPADSTRATQISYRHLASLLNENVGAQLPLYVFTDNYLRNFDGDRTTVSLNLHWFTYTPGIKAVTPLADTTAMRVTIVSGARGNDAHYLQAALDAIQQFSKNKVVTQLISPGAAMPAAQDWLFWLSDVAMPANVAARNIVQYAAGKPIPCRSVILPAAGSSFDAVELYSSVIETDSNKIFSAVLWKDGYGRTVLASERKNKTDYYWLYTHIDPAWNELPWSENFPQLLYELVYHNGQAQPPRGPEDSTIISNTQVMPVIKIEKDRDPKQVLYTTLQLESFFWMVAFLLFFAERCLAFHHRKISMNG